MQKYFSLFAFLLLSTFVQAQAVTLGNWDFEQPCLNPSNAFLAGCVNSAIATSGMPSLSGTPGVNQFATMDIRHCSVTPNDRMHGEGIALNVNIPSGKKIRVKFSFMHEGWPGQGGGNPLMGVHFVNGQPSFGGPGNCSGNDVIPAIPQGAVTLGAVGAVTTPANVWTTEIFEFTTTGSFNQVWFRPFLDLSELAFNEDFSTKVHIDNVCIIDATCEPEPFKALLCRDPNTGYIVVTIDGANSVAQSGWSLFRMSDCNNGPGTLWSVAPINWLTANSFTLKPNTGCYTLGYSFNPRGCPGRFVSQVINTGLDNIPNCPLDACSSWDIQVTEQFCYFTRFQVTPLTPFPPGTIITGSINGSFPTVLPNGMIEYFPVDQGDNLWLEVCFTVYQPGCETETQCVYRYIPNCEGLQGGGSDDRNKAVIELTDKQTLRFTNPADQYIRFSAPIEAGVAQLYSIQGALVKSFVLNGTQQLEVGDMPDGQYMLSVQRATGRESKLVLIMH